MKAMKSFIEITPYQPHYCLLCLRLKVNVSKFKDNKYLIRLHCVIYYSLECTRNEKVIIICLETFN